MGKLNDKMKYIKNKYSNDEDINELSRILFGYMTAQRLKQKKLDEFLEKVERYTQIDYDTLDEVHNNQLELEDLIKEFYENN